jgi:hypothetical protein
MGTVYREEGPDGQVAVKVVRAECRAAMVERVRVHRGIAHAG